MRRGVLDGNFALAGVAAVVFVRCMERQGGDTLDQGDTGRAPSGKESEWRFDDSNTNADFGKAQMTWTRASATVAADPR